MIENIYHVCALKFPDKIFEKILKKK